MAPTLSLDVIWMGTGFPLQVGGVLARFDGKTWQTYTASTSGYSGAEATTLARDGRGRLWIGTQTAGVDVIQLSR